MKVMSAIERCRTAALGGHVERCENDACGHTAIAYNTRNGLALIGPSTVACLIGSGLLQAAAHHVRQIGKFKPVALRQIHTAGDTRRKSRYWLRRETYHRCYSSHALAFRGKQLD